MQSLSGNTRSASVSEQTSRQRVGCQQCRNRRRKCDQTAPECSACLRRGLRCSGYQRPIVFKDVSRQTADSSRKVEARRWTALRRVDTGREEQSRGMAQQGSVPAGVNVQRPLPKSLEQQAGPFVSGSWQSLCEASINVAPDEAFQSPSPRISASPTIAEHITTVDSADLSIDGSIDDQTLQSLTANYLPGLETDADSPSTFLGNCTSPTSIVDDIEEFLSTAMEGSSSTHEDGYLHVWNPLQTTEEIFVGFFEHEISKRLPVSLEFASWYRNDPCFRTAVLTLSTATALRHKGAVSQRDGAMGQIEYAQRSHSFYQTALNEMRERIYDLDGPHVPQGESLAGASLILAYHEMQAGSSLGVRHQAFNLDLIASKIQSKLVSNPELLKAWRLLRCDKRFISMPTRTGAGDLDGHEIFHTLSPELTIRDILLKVWKMHTRYAVEATFQPPTAREPTESGAKQSGHWLRTVLNRDSDHRQARQDDYHNSNLTKHHIVKTCEEITVQLDKWHSALSADEIPSIRAGSSDDFMTVAPFNPIPTYRIADEGKAINYLLYLLSRMTCAYLRSIFDPSATASATHAWGVMVLGLACGTPMNRSKFTTISIDELLLMAALLSEGTQTTTLLLECLVPRLVDNEATEADKLPWAYVKSCLHLIQRERYKGKAIRFMIDGSHESATAEDTRQPHAVAVFGDFNGKGHFRDIYQIC